MRIKKSYRSRIVAVLGLAEIAALSLMGCTTSWQPPRPADHATVQRDPLSYGAVTSKVKKGETTQEDIVRLFGAPNVTTMNKGGEEVWMYDRISSTSDANDWSEYRRFNAFFAFETFSAKEGGSRSSTTSTLTVIITFDEKKCVKDYSARATQF